MSESQSRYSIVERLTQRKLDIMTAKAELKDKLKQKEQTIEELKHEFIIWKEDVEEDVKRQRRNLERDIDKAQQEYELEKARMSEKAGAYEEKIRAIETALKSVEEISKTSATVQS